MRGIAKLLFGDEAGRRPGVLGDGGADGFGLAEQARRSGEWCASTPGSGLGAGAARGLARPGGARRHAAPRELRSR